MHIKVSDQGQLVIPPTLLQQLGIQSDTWLEVDAEQGGLRLSVIQNNSAKTPVKSGLGLAGYSGKQLAIEDMDPVRALLPAEGEQS